VSAQASQRALAPDVAELVSLSAAVAVADPEAVAACADRALAAGAKAAAVYETILQSYLFVGFPRAIEGFFAARDALAHAGGVLAAGNGYAWPSQADLAAWRRDGEALCRRVYGRNYERLRARMDELSPELGRWMILEGYGKTLSRSALDAPSREYAALAILAVTRMWRQLRSHAIGALNVGGTREGVREAITRTEPFCGAEGVRAALRAAGLRGGRDAG
jgi:4-carboxymuconolactone decarboxylase